MTTLSITSWQDVAILMGIVATFAGISGGLIRSRLDKKNAEAASSDRLIRLVEAEAEKRVEIVRTEFKLQIAELQLEHRSEITKMKTDFEKQLKALRLEHENLRCDLAPVCSWRNKKVAPPPASLS